MKKIFIIIYVFVITFSFINAEKVVNEKDKEIYYTNVDRTEYPNASAAILLDETVINLKKDMSYTKKRRVIKKILTYKGKKEHSEYRIYYDRRDEKVDLKDVTTVALTRANKFKVTAADMDAIRDLDAPFDAGKMDYAVHNMKIIPFANTGVNKIVNIEYEIKSDEKNKFADRILFANNEPIYRKIYKIIMPKEMKLNYFFDDNKINFNEEVKGDKKILVWEKNKLEQIISEENMPAKSYFLPALNITSYNNWDELKKTLKKKITDKINVTDKIKKRTKEITSGSKNIKEEIYTLKQFVAKNINHINVNNLLDFEYKTAEQVLENGYASSFDKTILFLSMLKSIGIEGVPVAVSMDQFYWDKYKSFINPGDFNSIIPMVNIDNKNYYINLNSEFIKLDESNYYNQTGMNLYKDDNYFVEIDDVNNQNSKMEIVYNIEIDKNGNAVINKKSKYYDFFAVSKRRKFKYMTEKKKKQDFEQLIGRISQNAEAISPQRKISLGDVVEIEYKYKHDGFAVKDGEFMYFDIPITMSRYGFNKAKSERKYPYINLSESEYEITLNIKTPSNFKSIINPREIKKQTEIFNLSKDVEIKNKNIQVNYFFKKKPGYLDLDEYKEIYDLNINLLHPKHKRVLLKEDKKFLGIF